MKDDYDYPLRINKLGSKWLKTLDQVERGSETKIYKGKKENMNTISMRLNEEELVELESAVQLASVSIKVSRHSVMKSAMKRGLKAMMKELSLLGDCPPGVVETSS